MMHVLKTMQEIVIFKVKANAMHKSALARDSTLEIIFTYRVFQGTLSGRIFKTASGEIEDGFVEKKIIAGGEDGLVANIEWFSYFCWQPGGFGCNRFPK